MDKVTVVTVCYNAEHSILSTMESVLNQTYESIEYIVVDGKSSDSTMKIIESIKNRFDCSGNIELRVVSEKDSGIYDAMNKGIDMATGEWIIFMNAGDCFHEKETISKVFANQYYQDVIGVFGDTVRVRENKRTYVKGEQLEQIKNGFPLPFCHQSVFVRVWLAKTQKFDTTYKQAADYDFFVRTYKMGVHFEYSPVIISDYMMGGVSETNTVLHLKEKIAIREKHELEFFSPLKKIYLVKKLSYKQIIKRWIPKSILTQISK